MVIAPKTEQRRKPEPPQETFEQFRKRELDFLRGKKFEQQRQQESRRADPMTGLPSSYEGDGL